MKDTAFQRVLDKLIGIERAARAVEAVQAAHVADTPPETPDEEHGGKDLFHMVPAADHRPEMPDHDHAMTFDPATGLPHVAMERFPLPHDEDDTEDLGAFA